MRTNKIIRVPANKMSMKYLYDVLIDYLQEGAEGWELVRNQPTPYGAVFKIPNYKDGEFGYAGIMYDDIKVGQSYWNWLKQDDVLREEFAYNPDGINLSQTDTQYIQTENGNVHNYNRATRSLPYDVPTKNGKKRIYVTEEYFPHDTMYYFQPKPDIFKKDASVIFFSMFKQYDSAFTWNQLMGTQRVNPKLRRLEYYSSPGGAWPYFMNKPPLYPGVGSPVMATSPGFFSQNNRGNEFVYIYLSKTKHNAIITINFRDYWDMAEIGFFTPFDSNFEYGFPAMAISSNSGICPQGELITWLPGIPFINENFILDYTENNRSFGHAMPNFAATWYDGSQNFLDTMPYSAVQAMLPDGVWQSFFNYGIRADSFYNHTWGLYFSSFREPEKVNSRYFITPNITPLNKTINTVPMIQNLFDVEWNLDNIDEMIEKQNTQQYNILPMYLVESRKDNVDQNILGIIPDIYWCSNPVTRYGIYKKDGKVYLVVPNCWEGRKYHLKNYFSVLLNEPQNEDRMNAEMARLENLSQAMNMVIDIGENTEFIKV